jgi:hypothetical protein
MPFTKGKSGNPAGRKPGLTARGRFRQQVESALPSIVQGLIEAAQGGDVQAANIILSKVIPNQKPTSDSVRIPMAADGSLADKGMAVLAAASKGDLNPDDAHGVMGLLVSQAKLVEQSEILDRLQAVENWLAMKK